MAQNEQTTEEHNKSQMRFLRETLSASGKNQLVAENIKNDFCLLSK